MCPAEIEAVPCVAVGIGVDGSPLSEVLVETAGVGRAEFRAKNHRRAHGRGGFAAVVAGGNGIGVSAGLLHSGLEPFGLCYAGGYSHLSGITDNIVSETVKVGPAAVDTRGDRIPVYTCRIGRGLFNLYFRNSRRDIASHKSADSGRHAGAAAVIGRYQPGVHGAVGRCDIVGVRRFRAGLCRSQGAYKFAVAFDFHAGDCLKRLAAVCLRGVHPRQHGMRSAVFAGCDPGRLHCVGTARSCGISGNIETGKLVVAEFLMASHRSRRNIYCGHETLRNLNRTAFIHHAGGCDPVQLACGIVELHGLEALRIMTGVAYHAHIAAVLVDSAEVALIAYAIELARIGRRQGKEPAVECGHSGGSAVGEADSEECRPGISDSRNGIHRRGRVVVGHVVDQALIAAEPAYGGVGSLLNVEPHQSFGHLLRSCHLGSGNVIAACCICTGGSSLTESDRAGEYRLLIAHQIEPHDIVRKARLFVAEGKNAISGIIDRCIHMPRLSCESHQQHKAADQHSCEMFHSIKVNK